LIQDHELGQAKDAFSKLYKLLPLFPPALTRWLCDRRRYERLRFLPSFLVILGQLLVAAKGRDYRYVIYLKYYPLRMRRAIQKKWFFAGKGMPAAGPDHRMAP
ncbi:MAG: hypothetical protein ACLFPD_02535, partial [Desulfosudaceae bacterium]